MSPTPIRSRAALSVLLFSLAACGLPLDLDGDRDLDCSTVLCGACAPALTVRVTGTSGQSPPEVVLGSGQGSCSRDVSATVCNPSQSGAGRYELDLQAPGYRPVHLVEEVPAVERTGCCHCGYEPRVVDVRLVPE